MKRRIWFAAFSDYYHSANEDTGMPERKVDDKFGMNIPDHYGEAD